MSLDEYERASAEMAAHFERARAGQPCACLGAARGRDELCPEGAQIYARIVSAFRGESAAAAASDDPARCRKCGAFLSAVRVEMRIDRCWKCEGKRR